MGLMPHLRLYTLNSVASHLCNQSARDITEFSSVNMDAWYYRISVACDTMEFEIILLSPPLMWSTSLCLTGNVAYACTNIQQVASIEEEEEE